MLTRPASGIRTVARRVAQLLAATMVAAGLVVVAAEPALADYIYCPPDNGPCWIVVTGTGGGSGGGGGGGGGSGGSGLCLHDQLGWISCYKAGLGWFNPIDACFYDRLDLPLSDPAWGGNDPAQGDLYAVWCWAGLSGGWQLVDIRYRTSPPPGYGGLPSVLTLALRAINQLPIRAPVIRTAPSRAGAGLVGLPVWMWTSAAGTWGTYSATASVPGRSVTATARSTKIVWKMGDGATVTCRNRGTPYLVSYGYRFSPTCGYAGYKKPSRYQSTGRYTITATTTWVVTWSGGGESGTVTIYRTSTATLRIDELQVVTQ